MPVSLQRVKERTKTVTLDIDGESLTVTLRPDKFTPGDMAQMQERIKKAEAEEDAEAATRDFCNFMCDLIVSWDLRWSEGGEIVPIDPDVFYDDIPFTFLNELMDKSGTELQVGKQKRQT